MADDPSEVLVILTKLAEYPLSIISLSEPISASDTPPHNLDVAPDSLNIEYPTPASLEADLSHYKELFSKLRFSYLEQVTKEKFLRSIVGDPPLIVEPVENLELEAQLAEVKKVLTTQKANVANMVIELEKRGRKLSRCHESITLRTTLLSDLPQEIASLQLSLTALHSIPPSPESPYLLLSLPETKALLASRESELVAKEQKAKETEQDLARMIREQELQQNRLRELEAERDEKVMRAREALRRREEGGGVDELEARGRWLKASESGLSRMLELRLENGAVMT